MHFSASMTLFIVATPAATQLKWMSVTLLPSHTLVFSIFYIL